MKNILIFTFLILLMNIGFAFAEDDVGVIYGNILLDEEAPELPRIVIDKNIDFCGEVLTDNVLMVKNRRIQGAVVALNWKGDEKISGGELYMPVQLQSRNCRFHPRIQATHLGNYLILNSGDEITHNPHGWWNNKKTIFNITLINPNQKFKRKLKWEGTYRVECDTHTWMKSYILVFKHPFYAVTGEEGSFRLDNVPTGIHTLRVWHEVLGEHTATVVVERGKETRMDFVLQLVDKRRKELIPKTVQPWPPDSNARPN